MVDVGAAAATALWLLRWSGDRSLLVREPIPRPDRAILDYLRERRIDGLAYLSFELTDAYQRLYERLWGLQRGVLASVSEALSAREVPALIFKGAEFLARYFDNRPIGMLFDVDLLVPRSLLEEVKIALHSLGLRQGRWDRESHRYLDRDVTEIARLEAAHYELAPFSLLCELTLREEEAEIVRHWNQHPLYWVDGRTFALVEVDIHHQVAFDIPTEPFLTRAVPSALQGALTLSPADLLWFTTSRFYTEVALHGKRSLRDFAYLSALLTVEAIDWEIVTRAAKEHGLHSSLYYYFEFLRRLSGAPIPEEVLSDLRPSRGLRLRDYGWQLGVLFDFVEEFPESLLAHRNLRT